VLYLGLLEIYEESWSINSPPKTCHENQNILVGLVVSQLGFADGCHPIYAI